MGAGVYFSFVNRLLHCLVSLSVFSPYPYDRGRRGRRWSLGKIFRVISKILRLRVHMFDILPLSKVPSCKSMHCRPPSNEVLFPWLVRACWTGVFKPDQFSSSWITINHGVPELIADDNVWIAVPCDVHGSSRHWRGKFRDLIAFPSFSVGQKCPSFQFLHGSYVGPRRYLTLQRFLLFYFQLSASTRIVSRIFT